MSVSFVVLGLGSNINPLQNLRTALVYLRQMDHCHILKVSRIYECKALTLNDDIQNDYLNAAVLIQISYFDPQELLIGLKKIEMKMGRAQGGKWRPREIDLDILYASQNGIAMAYQAHNLNIPHADFYKRPFAYLPTREVFPDVKGALSAENNILNCKVSHRFFWPEFSAILNMTPDSFSDGGIDQSEKALSDKIQQLIADGADYIDVGAESTRPGAMTLPIEVEKARLKRALDILKNFHSIKVSIDSRNFETLKYCIDQYDIHMINDVSGFADLKILDLVKAASVKAVAMHSLSVPADPTLTIEKNPISTLIDWWGRKLEILNSKNINLNDIYFDPGIGFGKKPIQSVEILNQLAEFKEIKEKIYLGYSRKSFLNVFSQRKPQDRDLETAFVTSHINLAYAQVIRVHDVLSQKIALRMSYGL
jgi:2-amino-4-hydroxy-6-hydroxymethyldihydropteridine diphosphokinase / dihydropteroate synthase